MKHIFAVSVLALVPVIEQAWAMVTESSDMEIAPTQTPIEVSPTYIPFAVRPSIIEGFPEVKRALLRQSYPWEEGHHGHTAQDVEIIRGYLSQYREYDLINRLTWIGTYDKLLHMAVLNGRIEIVRVLLELGANPWLENADGFLAINHAIMRQFDDIETLLNRAMHHTN
ncbi:MAG TPA: ankyrin repeat domain-containing protein [Myxococcota bacterium]|nr:ankyrin repeat domain-containing protein [Myxococcota bacterium]